MRLQISIFAFLLPLVLAAKEVPGEELPSSDVSLLLKNENEDHNSDQTPSDGQNSMVKRSISEIAARRRSALDKSFMRFGRSDPSISEPRVKLSGNLMRFGRSKQNSYLRLGRGRPQDFMRFGRSTGNMMRFGRAANLMRFGRGGNNMMRFGRGGNNMMRFGRGGNNMMRFGRGGNNMMRFGRGGNNMMRFGRGGNNMMRFGRSDNDFLNYENDPEFDIDDEIDNEVENTPAPADTYARVERSVDIDKKPKSSNYADRQNDNFMRLGRSLLEKNYYDSDEDGNENQEQYIASALDNENDKISKTQKSKMYMGDNFMRLGGENAENPDEIQDSFELIFPEESRWKRSLIKVNPTNKPSAVASESSDDHPEVSSVRHSRLDAMENCSS